MVFSLDWNIILSVITSAAAVFAIFQTQKQIKLSNSHHLFDRKIDDYKFYIKLFNKFSATREALLGDKEIENNSLFYLDFLIEIPSLISLKNVIDNPLSESNRLRFYETCGVIEEKAFEINVVFSKHSSELMSEFCSQYKVLLFALFSEHLKNEKKIYEASKELGYGNTEYDRVYILSNGTNVRDTVKKAEDVYQKIISGQVNEKLIRQIKLK